MSKQTEAIKLAIEVFGGGDWHDEIVDTDWADKANNAITALREALAEQPAQQEPVAWQILNGVCHAGIRSSESLAKEAASGMQKTHDLGGSLAAFHVRPLYATPQPPAQQGQTIDVAFLKQVLSVAICGLYYYCKDDVLRAFTLDELQTVLGVADPLQPQQVEDIYKRAWVMLAAAEREAAKKGGAS